MDVNETLAQIRRLSDGITYGAENDMDPERIAGLAETLAELTRALDGWITNGGFLPAAWVR